MVTDAESKIGFGVKPTRRQYPKKERWYTYAIEIATYSKKESAALLILKNIESGIASGADARGPLKSPYEKWE